MSEKFNYNQNDDPTLYDDPNLGDNTEYLQFGNLQEILEAKLSYPIGMMAVNASKIENLEVSER